MDYASCICNYCWYTDYGLEASSTITPNGYVSCEGIGCLDAYKKYVEDTGDNVPIDDLF